MGCAEDREKWGTGPSPPQRAWWMMPPCGLDCGAFLLPIQFPLGEESSCPPPLQAFLGTVS